MLNLKKKAGKNFKKSIHRASVAVMVKQWPTETVAVMAVDLAVWKWRSNGDWVVTVTNRWRTERSRARRSDKSWRTDGGSWRCGAAMVGGCCLLARSVGGAAQLLRAVAWRLVLLQSSIFNLNSWLHFAIGQRDGQCLYLYFPFSPFFLTYYKIWARSGFRIFGAVPGPVPTNIRIFIFNT